MVPVRTHSTRRKRNRREIKIWLVVNERVDVMPAMEKTFMIRRAAFPVLLSWFLATAPLQAAETGPSSSASVTPQRGGTVTFATASQPTALVSFLETKTDDRDISTKITEGLLRYDPHFVAQPLLAQSWEISADGLRYTFHLRPNVRFSDGEALTSEDVKFSILQQKQRGPRGRITFANVTTVETPDPLTAVLVLTKPAPYLIKALSSAETPIVPRHRYPNPDDPLSSPNTNAPIGTGPYILVNWKRGDCIELRRNPHYWRTGHPYLDRIIIKIIPDASAIATTLESGGADIAENVALPDLDRLGKNPALRVDSTTDAYLNNASFLEFNVENPILAKPEVRHAIAQAVNRDLIVKVVLFGRAQRIDSPVPKVLQSYYDDSTFHYPFDIDAANRLLDQAGYPRKANGERLSLRITYIPGINFAHTADFLRSSLKRIGIAATIIGGDLPTYLKHVYTTRDFDLNINGLGRLYDPSVGVQRIYWSDGVPHPLIWVNASHCQNDEVDRLFSEAAEAVDDNKRAANFREIQRIVGSDLPVLPLASVPTLTVSRTYLHDWVNSVDVLSGDASDAWIDAKK